MTQASGEKGATDRGVAERIVTVYTMTELDSGYKLVV